MDELINYRKKLDVIDKEIVQLLGDRFNICVQVAHYKKKENIPMMQPERVDEVISSRAKLGENHNITSSFMKKLYRLIIDESCRLEDDIIDE